MKKQILTLFFAVLSLTIMAQNGPTEYDRSSMICVGYGSPTGTPDTLYGCFLDYVDLSTNPYTRYSWNNHSSAWELFSTFEADPIYAGDSSKIVWFQDTLSVIATKYDIDTLQGNLDTHGIDEVLAIDNSTTLDLTVGTIAGDTLHLVGGSGQQGKMYWDADEETFSLIMNGSTGQLTQELHVHCRNNSGVTIPDGAVVMKTGTIGASGRITIGLYDGTSDVHLIIGIATEDIANNDDGKVVPFGKVRDINTASWNEDDDLYPTAAGGLTNVEPTSGVKNVIATVVTKHATNGTILVRFTPHDEQYLANQRLSLSGNTLTLTDGYGTSLDAVPISITEAAISDLDHFTTSDETDPVYSAWDKSTGITITESQISDLDHFVNGDETDQIYAADSAKIVWFADTVSTIATKYDIDTVTANINALTTSDIAEGSNLYYTEARVSANTDVAANTSARHSAVTVSGTPDYITLSGQDIVRGQVDLATDVTGTLPTVNYQDSTIYNSDGTLSGNRTVTMGGNNLTFDGGGNVGLGTTSPNAKLDIITSGTTRGIIITTSGTGDFFRAMNDDDLRMYIDTDGNIRFSTGSASSILNEGSGVLSLGTDDTRTLHISDGNVGVGIITPLSILHLNGGVGSLSTGLSFGDGDGGIWERTDDNSVWTTDSLELQGGLSVDGESDVSGGGSYGGDVDMNGNYLLGSEVGSDAAYYFDGVDDVVTIADDDDLDITDAITIRARFKTNDGTNGQFVFAKGSNYYIYIDLDATNDIRFRHNGGGDGYTDVNANITTNKYYDIICTYDGVNTAVYLDGAYIGGEAATGTLVSNANNLEVGVFASGNYFSGHIASVQLWNRALSASEIKSLYNGSGIPFNDRGASQTELVTNGTFDADTDWIKSGSTISGGQVTIPGDGVSFNRITQNHTNINTSGKKYRLSYEVVSNTLTGTVRWNFAGGGIRYISSAVVYMDSEVGSHVYEFESNNDGGEFVIQVNNNSTGGSIVLDNISLTQIGSVLDLNQTGISTDTWYDASGNSLTGTVSGATPINPLLPRFGEMSLDSNTVAETTTAAWSDVTAGTWNAGHLNGFTLSDSELTASADGYYMVTVSVSSQSASGSATYQFGVSVNDAAPDDSHVISRRFSTTDVGANSLSGLLFLNAGDTVEMKHRQVAGSLANLTVKYCNFSIIKI